MEVNPLAETPQGKIYTADAKLGFDDNAAFRQKAIFDMEDTTESDPREVEAASYNLNYVQVSFKGVVKSWDTQRPSLLGLFRVSFTSYNEGHPCYFRSKRGVRISFKKPEASCKIFILI